MKKLIFFSAFFIISYMIKAEVKLPHVFGNNMVLQRDMKTKVWGWANPGEKITVQFNNQKKNGKADEKGDWLIILDEEKAGGPYDMVIKGKNELVLKNVLMGDVWICSGQSNMEWPLINTLEGELEVKNCVNPNIRLLTVNQAVSLNPENDIKTAGWMECNPENARSFSAVAYYFGKYVQKEQNIPVGLISTNWGGTNIESWTSKEGCEKDPYLKKWADETIGLDGEVLKAKEKEKQKGYVEAFDKATGKNGTNHPYSEKNFDDSEWHTVKLPGLWEDSEIGIFDGIVWFRKKFNLPDNFRSNGCKLFVGKIDDSDITWINGVIVGQTFMKYNQVREYSLPDGLLKPGENSIVVRVEDYIGGGGIYGDDTYLSVKSGDQSISLTGDWKFFKEDLALPRNPANPEGSILNPNDYPTLLYNAMISPITRYGIKGAIWYQGENNANSIKQSLQYKGLFEIMIRDWREHWNQGDFSFLFAQLANYMKPQGNIPVDESWPYVRESQTKVLKTVPNTGMACIIDIGNADDIHPRNKKDVGYRLALNAFKITYGKELVYSGPMFKTVEFKGNKAILTFDHTGEGLQVINKYGYVNGFIAAGADKKFYYVKAEITGPGKIILTSDKIDKIEAVRYGWANNPDDVNLYNSAGLPAVPFRTDEW